MKACGARLPGSRTNEKKAAFAKWFMAETKPRPRLQEAAFFFLWLFAAVTLLSIAAQNLFFVSLALGLAAAWQGRQARGLAWLRPSLLLCGALPFLFLALIASVASENQAHSLETWRKWLLMLALWWTPALVSDDRRLKAVLGALLFFSALWAVGSSLLALYGPLHAWAGGEAFASVAARWTEVGEWRAISGSGGYMVMGTGCMLLLVFFGALAIEDAQWRRPLALASLAALALALLLTQTRGAWIGAALALALLLLIRQPRTLWVVAALALPLLAWPRSPVRARLAESFDMTQDSTRERVYMAQAGLAIIRDHPWLGVGDAMESWDGHPGFYRRYLPEGAKKWDSLRDQEHGHLHNDPIQVAAMYGLPALCALLFFFAVLARNAHRQTRSSSPQGRGISWGVLAVILAWWINGLVEYNFGSFQSSFTLWFLLGLGLAAAKLQDQA
jgi:O-antigen ligase